MTDKKNVNLSETSEEALEKLLYEDHEGDDDEEESKDDDAPDVNS